MKSQLTGKYLFLQLQPCINLGCFKVDELVAFHRVLGATVGHAAFAA